MAHNGIGLGEVPPCRMLKFSTKACGGILPNHCYKPFFFLVWYNNLIKKMKVKLKIEKEFEVKYLLAEVGARYWENATVNGEEDTEGTLIPCRDGEYWKPLIDIETGVITNWDKGHTASVHYKCCDDGLYKLLDENQNEVKSIEGYVPKIMCPKENGYGDYVIMDIDREGKIANWKADLSDFQDDE
ncbi:hypothetical protein [Acinetobacter sp.]|uniref:hypothetical protein n=1 Tax=Acinetobacter sp. TaxID=472 RepID=UPI0025BB1502|nr:hypothetical protein [Acinetobacter sp.]